MPGRSATFAGRSSWAASTPCRRRPSGSPLRKAAAPITTLEGDAGRSDEIDVVTIGTPSGAHLEPAVAAARAGKHVIVEKPLEITLKRCDQIIRECEKAGVTCSAIFPSRFHRLEHRTETGRRRRALRPSDAGRRLREVVSHASLLRQRRLARHLGARRRRRADEPGDSQRRSAHLADGPVVEIRPTRACWPTSGSRSKTRPWPRYGSPAARWA